jgi:hypothetical protein
MAYLGNKPVNNFVSFAKQDITGNGGTSYSLDYPVTGANDIDLYINNVRQEPTEAYSCSGSTLTLTEAVSSSDDIYAIFRGRALQTVNHPSDTALEASQATISGDATITGNAFIGANGTAVPNANLASNLDFLQVGTGTIIQAGADSQSFIKSNHYWNGSSTSFQDTTRGSTTIRLNENNAGILQFETATSGGVGTTSRLTIDASGRVTMPYQPVFSYLGSKSHDIATTSTQVMSSSNVWSSNVNHALNRGSHFNPSTGRFTAPIAGTYHFQFQCTYNDFGSGYLWFYLRKNGSAISYMQASQQTPHSAIVHHGYFELSANDYIECAWTNNYASGNIHYPGFSGMLVG